MPIVYPVVMLFLVFQFVMEMRCRRIPTFWLMIVSAAVVVSSSSFVFTFRRLFATTTTTTTLHQYDEDEPLTERSRLLCFVLVDARNIDAAVAVKETWGQRGCDTLLFFRFV